MCRSGRTYIPYADLPMPNIRLTGKRCFDGKTKASLIGAVLGAEPAPMSTLVPMTPLALERCKIFPSARRSLKSRISGSGSLNLISHRHEFDGKSANDLGYRPRTEGLLDNPNDGIPDQDPAPCAFTLRHSQNNPDSGEPEVGGEGVDQTRTAARNVILVDDDECSVKHRNHCGGFVSVAGEADRKSVSAATQGLGKLLVAGDHEHIRGLPGRAPVVRTIGTRIVTIRHLPMGFTFDAADNLKTQDRRNRSE